MPANTVTAVRARVSVELELTVTDGSPVLNNFGDTEPVTGVRITFVDNKLTALRLDTAVPQHSAFVDQPDLEQPQKWPAFLREAVSAHDPAARTREVADLRATLAAFRDVLNNTALPAELHNQLVHLLEG